MARAGDVKIRILAIERMFQKGKPLNTTTIINKLKMEYDIVANRKTIYDDIAALNMFLPIDIVELGGRKYYRLENYDRFKQEVFIWQV